MRSLHLPPITPTDEILEDLVVARRVLKVTGMRSSHLALLCSLAASAACMVADSHRPHGGPDAGTTTASKCDTEQSISQNWTINSADGFGNPPSGCYHLDGTLTLSGAAITSLAKLGDIRGVKDLVIDHTTLTAIDSKSPITVTNSLSVTDNVKLASLANLEFDDGVTLAGIAIERNSALTDVTALAPIAIVAGPTLVDNNTKLATLGMPKLSRAEAGLKIHDNPALTKIDLGALQSVTGDFGIQSNQLLTDLGSWSSLQYVHGVLIIDSNPALASLDQTMTSAVSEIYQLTINNNPNLTSVGQLAHTGYFDTTFTVTNNPKLSYCVIREVGCCVAHTADTISGNLGTSCNSGPHSWCYAQNGNTCPYVY